MKRHRYVRAMRASILGAACLFLQFPWAAAIAGGSQTPHVTDGIVTPGEWPTPTSSQLFFPLDTSTGAGGAFLYVDQGSSTGGSPGGTLGTNLYLLYDYVSNTLPPNPNSFFDVFFQVKPENTDYLVRIMGTTFSAFEKPDNVPAPTPGGGFNPTQPPWTPLTSSDLTLANFSGAIGFGTSPNSSSNHQIAEFQLTINSSGPPPNGIYDPSPAFWSASTGGGNPATGPSDPPISSGIFTLNPNGTTTVTPVLGPNGDPILQPAVPEPGSLLLAGLGVLSVLGYRYAAGRLKFTRSR
jgi:hypothetical protein